MSDLTSHLLSGLKELYGKEEMSDKVLHIVEVDEEVFFPMTSCSNGSTDSLQFKEELLFEEEVEYSSTKTKSVLSEDKNKHLPTNHFLQDDGKIASKRKIKEEEETDVIQKKSKSSSKNKTITRKSVIMDTNTKHNEDISDEDEHTINEMTTNVECVLPLSKRGASVEVEKLSNINKKETVLNFVENIEKDALLLNESDKECFNQCGDCHVFKESKNLSMSDDITDKEIITKHDAMSSAGHMTVENETDVAVTTKQDVLPVVSTVEESGARMINSSENSDIIPFPENGVSYQSDMVEVVPYIVLPVHSIIMSLNSNYFKTLFAASGMRETYEKYIAVQVNIGEGQYLQKLIHSFYDQTILNGLGTLDLLHVLEIADRFSCDIYVQKCAVLLQDANVKSLAECNTMLLHIEKLESKIKLFRTTYTDMKQCCIRFLVKLFCPLENKTNEHDNFQSLHFCSLLSLLHSNEPITWSENSLLVFVAAWLDHDESRQTSSNIEALFRGINFQFLTPEFLFDEITINHPIFTLWVHFKTWFVDAMAYHAFTKSRMLPLVHPNRDYKSMILVPGWIVKFELVGLNCFSLSDDFLSLWRGYIIKPRLFIKESGIKGLYDLKIHVTHSTLPEESLFHNFDLHFTLAIAIFPKDEPYNNLLFSIKCRKFLKHHFRQVNIDFHSRTDYCSFDLGYVTKELLQCANGFQIAMAFKEKADRWPEFMRTIPSLENDKCYLEKSCSYWQWHHDKL